MKKIFLITAFLLTSTLAFAESMTMVTYYPAPFGSYDRLRLVPRDGTSGIACTPALEGLMYYDQTAHVLKVCGASGTFGGFGGGWTEGLNKLYTTNYTNPNLLVGIGTDVPQFKLTLDAGNTTGGYLKDGGIYAQGTIDQGRDLPDNSPAVDMTRFIWYPKKAAIRAGAVDDDNVGVWTQPDLSDNGLMLSVGGTALNSQDSWNDANVGKYSVALGRSTKASGESAVALGRYTTASGIGSVAAGDTAVASGISSVALGDDPYAQGSYAVAIGKRVRAQAKASFVAGACGTANGNTTTWVATDPIFAIGNGVLSASPVDTCTSGLSNALTILKNGNVGIGKDATAPGFTLTIKNNSTTKQGGGILFEGDNKDNTTPNAVLLPTTTSFPQYGYSDSNYGKNYFIYYPYKSALRVGANQDVDDDDNSGTARVNPLQDAYIGNNSIAMGFGAYAPAHSAVAIGEIAQARANYSMAYGFDAQARGRYSSALTHFSMATGAFSNAMGYGMVVDGNSSFGISLYSPCTCPGTWGSCPASVLTNPIQPGCNAGPSEAYPNVFPFGPRVHVAQSNTMAIMGGKVGIGNVAPNGKLTITRTLPEAGQPDHGGQNGWWWGTISFFHDDEASGGKDYQGDMVYDGGTDGIFSFKNTADGGITNFSGTSGHPGLSIVSPSSAGADDAMVGVRRHPTYTFDVAGDINASGCYRVNGAYWNGTCVSDERLKRDMRPLTGSLEKITQLKPATFEFINEKNGRGKQTGLIAQDVEKVFPSWVSTGEDGYKRVNYGGAEVEMHFIEAIKELKTENDLQKNENAQLKKRLDKQQEEIEFLKTKIK